MDDYVKEQKERMLNELDEIETECHILLANITSMRIDLDDVETREQAVRFDETHNLEYGLEHIIIL